MSILERVKPMEEMSPWLHQFIYADPGAGKTVLSATAPKPVLIAGDNGFISLFNHETVKDTPVLKVEVWNDVKEIVQEIRRGELADRETIIIDNSTELQKKNLDSIVKEARRTKNLPLEVDYKVSSQDFRAFLLSLFDLPRHLIITSHVTADKDGFDEHVFKRPALTPAVATTIQGLMDVIGYLEYDREADKRTLQVWGTRRIEAKTRIKSLPTTIDNPHMDYIFKEWNKMVQEANQNA